MLRGSVLILYVPGEDVETATPYSIISLEHCLVQALDETSKLSKKDFVFSLGVNNGNVFYLQSTSKNDLDEWVYSINITASIWETRRYFCECDASVIFF